MMQRTANKYAACERRICKRSDQPKINRITNNDARLILRKKLNGCQLVSRPAPPEPIRTTPLPTRPWRDLAIDLLGSLPTGESILVVVDY